MDGSGSTPSGANGANGAYGANGESKRRGRRYYVGENGVNVWRGGMEVDDFMLDGVGESRYFYTRVKQGADTVILPSARR
jgi:actin-like protein 6A